MQRETQARETAQAALKKDEGEFEHTRQQHVEAIAKLNLEKKEAFDSFDAYKKLFDSQLATLSTKNNELTTANSTLAETVDKKTEELTEYTSLDFANPQGKVIRTTDGGTTVWINLGHDDGLREGVAFTVVDE